MGELTSERLIDAPAAELWKLIEEPEQRGLVDERLVSSRLLAPGPDGAAVGRRERQVFRYAGTDLEVDSVITQHEPPRAFAWRVEETRVHGRRLRGPEQEYELRLEPEGEATRVRLQVRMSPQGLSARLGLRLSRKPTLASLNDSLARLERVALGEPAGQTAALRTPEPSSLVSRIDLGTLSVGLTILTGVAYLVLRTVTDIFYAPLRLAPEDVGLGQAELLGRSLGLVLVSLSVTANLMVLASAVARRRLVRWVAVVPLLAIWLLIGWHVDSAIPMLIFVATAVLQMTIILVGSRQVMMDAVTVRGLISLLILVTTLLSLLAYGAALASLAVQSRRGVEEGIGLSDAASVLLPWEATPADVAWKGRTAPPLDIPACGVYLGTSGSTTLLYDSLGAVLVRVPSADVLLHLRTVSGASCP